MEQDNSSHYVHSAKCLKTSPDYREQYTGEHGAGGWLTICGETIPALEEQLKARAKQHLSVKGYTDNDVQYVAALERPLYQGNLKLSKVELEKLRALCQLWEVRLMPQKISSHRPVIGKIIVAVKRLLFPIFQVFMKDTMRQQRDFNAAVVSLLTELTSRTTRG